MPPKSDDTRPRENDRDPDDEDALDEELEESFPSSDPPGTGGPGV
jgi:hypothetical protein